MCPASVDRTLPPIVATPFSPRRPRGRERYSAAGDLNGNGDTVRRLAPSTQAPRPATRRRVGQVPSAQEHRWIGFHVRFGVAAWCFRNGGAAPQPTGSRMTCSWRHRLSAFPQHTGAARVAPRVSKKRGFMRLTETLGP